jgi:hypothetical protein
MAATADTGPFILGLNHRIDDSAFMSTEDLDKAVGENTGNLAFHYAIDRHLGGGLPTVDWYRNLPGANLQHGTAVIPCANQLGPHANHGKLAARFAALPNKMVAIGLGAQGPANGQLPEVPQGSLEWVRTIAAAAPSDGPNISVRGAYTLALLERHGLAAHAIVLGCPTLFINPDPHLGRKIAARIGKPRYIGVAAGHHKWTWLQKLEHSLARLVEDGRGSYIVQSPLAMLRLARAEAPLMDRDALAECNAHIRPDLDVERFADWCRRHAHVFFNVPAWLEHLRGFDFVVGARIHGVVLALQAGVPALCIAHDSRTVELCQTMRIPYVEARSVLMGLTERDLLMHFQFDPAAFDANRAELATRYVQFLRRNRLAPSKALTALIA